MRQQQYSDFMRRVTWYLLYSTRLSIAVQVGNAADDDMFTAHTRNGGSQAFFCQPMPMCEIRQLLMCSFDRDTVDRSVLAQSGQKDDGCLKEFCC